MRIGKQFEKQREKFQKETETSDKSSSFLEKRSEFCKRMTKARKVHPERTVSTLYRPVFPGNVTSPLMRRSIKMNSSNRISLHV